MVMTVAIMVATGASRPSESMKASAWHTVIVRPARITRPRAINSSPLAGARRLTLNSMGQDARALRHQAEGRVAARTVERGSDDTGVEEPVLLRQVGAEGQADVDLACGNVRQSRADRGHQRLRRKALADGPREVRVLRCRHVCWSLGVQPNAAE
jgi:hypothetical protein